MIVSTVYNRMIVSLSIIEVLAPRSIIE
jgi:hypothetical protein